MIRGVGGSSQKGLDLWTREIYKRTIRLQAGDTSMDSVLFSRRGGFQTGAIDPHVTR